MSGPDGASTLLDDATEAEWALLHDQFELADGFWIGWMFSQTWTAPRVMAVRAEGLMRAGGNALRRWRPESPTALRELTTQLVHAAREATHDCLWVEALDDDAPSAPPEASWRLAWAELLMRMNEQREVFVRNHRGGLVFAGPPDLKASAQEHAPDLWTWRAIVVDFAYVPPRTPGRFPLLPMAEPPPFVAVGDSAFELQLAEQALTRAWSVTSATRVVTTVAIHLREAGRVDEARRLLLRLLALPRGRKAPRRWSAYALVMLAYCERDQGDVPAAIDHLRAAIELGDALDDELVARWCLALVELLEQVSDFSTAYAVVSRGARRAEKLVAAYADVESLQLLHRLLLVKSFIQERQGDLLGASRTIAETLDTCRRALGLRDGDPALVSDVAVTLARSGDTRLERGDLSGAETDYLEALKMQRTLVDHGEDQILEHKMLLMILQGLAEVRERLGHENTSVLEEARLVADRVRVLDHPGVHDDATPMASRPKNDGAT